MFDGGGVASPVELDSSDPFCGRLLATQETTLADSEELQSLRRSSPIMDEKGKANKKLGEVGLHQFEGQLVTDDDLQAEFWYEAKPDWPEPSAKEKSDLKSISDDQWMELCGEALSNASRVYDKQYSKSSSSALQTKSLTSSDKIATYTLAVQEHPLYRLDELHELLKIAQKRGHERNLSLDALKDLFVNNLLPDARLLKSIPQLDLSAISRKQLSKRHLTYMLYENELKQIYKQFIDVIEILSNDNLEFYKKKAIYILFDLLIAKPENERLLLSLLINKLGDPNKSISAVTMSKLVSIVREHHPLMKAVVVKEVIQFLRRPNLSVRSQYYAICFLNQIPFLKGNDDVKLARTIVQMYLDLFIIFITNSNKPASSQDDENDTSDKMKDKDALENEVLKKKSKKTRKKLMKQKLKEKQRKENQQLLTDEIKNSKIMSAILIGTNKAFPFTRPEEEEEANIKKYEQYFGKLFQIAHAESLQSATQSLSLIYQISKMSAVQNDRFYQALYARMLDITQASEKIQASFLHLVMKAVLSDNNMNRQKAFIKRLLQSALASSPSYSGACMVVLMECFKNNVSGKGLITSFLTLPENDDEDEIFFDADKLEMETIEAERSEKNNNSDDEDPPSEENEEDTKKRKKKEADKVADEDSIIAYDPRKRDPKFAKAERSSLWEIVSLANHFHPSISMFSEQLCKEMKVDEEINGDPLRDYSLITFLDRFCFKRVKNRLKKSLYGKQSNRYRDNPVANSKEFQQLMQSGKVEEDDKYMMKFFEQNPNRVARDPVEIENVDDLDVDSEEEAYDRAIEEEMSRLNGGGKDVLEDREIGLTGIGNRGPDVDEEDEDELKAFEKAFANEMVGSDDDGLDDDDDGDDEDTKDDEDDGSKNDDLNGLLLLPDDDNVTDDEDDEAMGEQKKKKKDKVKGFGGSSVFAAAEDYEEAIDRELKQAEAENEMDDGNDDDTKSGDKQTGNKKRRKRHSSPDEENSSKKRKRSKKSKKV